MKIQITSDLHTEFRPVDVPAVAEVIVAAGDLGAGEHALPLIDEWLAAGSQVVMVLGNHEFYGREYTEVIHQWQRCADQRPRLHLLDRGVLVLDGVRFLGATLWTDFDRSRARALRIGEQYMNDFRIIRYHGGRFPQRTPSDCTMRTWPGSTRHWPWITMARRSW